ncbi:unnamed protein product [Colias eurytheme]|nr:unnamed protein product [Colias eurytheme]
MQYYNKHKFNINVKKSTLFNLFIIALVSVILFGTYASYFYNVNAYNVLSKNIDSSGFYSESEKHGDIVNQYLDQRKSWKTSNLGSLLFKFQKTSDIGNTTRNGENKRFIVLIWKHWNWLKSRHIYNFHNERTPDIFDECRVSNCIFTGDEKYLDTADAVVIHIQRGIFPNTTRRNSEQRWIFLNDESPINAFSMTRAQPKLNELANVFNWSMTYRINAQNQCNDKTVIN